ncbi:neuronal PAS domain-containing protein 1-like [Vombatus ursinus]|uniref:neuronal PAS domain-containing protein 1 n=1 Tax=Vombatus ursinus TaxID=29139 RepID=UPI000FFD8142|nr:neuronal PAS domain-containing protein 1 [Vombatus ursinus]XP_027701778.1 neuronal PAS domain-containing protein 1-like [Vombatus ursinus]
MAAHFSGSEVKCVSVEWDFLQGLLVKAPPVPCLQALRKEKSRNAARSRRGKENFEFYELAKTLPLPSAITSQLDKASIVRLSITYLRLRDFASLGDPPWSPPRADPPPAPVSGAPGRRETSALFADLFEQHLGGHILQSLDGFVFALNQEGKFLYISETVSIYLGLSQVELTGSSVFDYVHPGDHSEVLEQLGLRAPPPGPGAPPFGPSSSSSSSSSSSASSISEAPETDEETEAQTEKGTGSRSPSRARMGAQLLCLHTQHSFHSKPLSFPLVKHPTSELAPPVIAPRNQPGSLERSFFIRMKSTLTKRGLHVKASGYKVIHVTGRLRTQLLTARRGQALGLVALGHTLPPAPLSELPLHGHTLVFRLSLALTIISCESRISDYMDVGPSELIGRSCYQYIHGEDAAGIRQSHLDLLDKGQVVTGYYRWLQRAGGFIWLQSVATVAISGKSPGERHVVWVSYILSQVESSHMALDALQLPSTTPQEDLSDPEPDIKESKAQVEGEQGASQPESGARHARGKRIKLEPARGSGSQGETTGGEGGEDSDDGESRHPVPRPEFTSVIRAGSLKRETMRPWSYAASYVAGEPFHRPPSPPDSPSPPTLVHAGYLAPTRGLYTSTIRYGPAELGLALPTPGLVYQHLQRLTGPGSTFPDALYPSVPFLGPDRKGD